MLEQAPDPLREELIGLRSPSIAKNMLNLYAADVDYSADSLETIYAGFDESRR
ncbi:MAG: hypothetical protein HZB40_15915 [Rhodocyclales bacterium]|nr:hypothetical protein [Rhodocyclales bacterium]